MKQIYTLVVALILGFTNLQAQQIEWIFSADLQNISQVGDVVNYTLEIIPYGNESFNQIDFSAPTGIPILQYQSGDTNGNTILETNETWIYTTSYVLTQDDLNNQGIPQGSGLIHFDSDVTLITTTNDAYLLNLQQDVYIDASTFLTNIVVCADNPNNSATVDLRIKDNEVLNGLNNSDYIIDYYANYNDANNAINEINNAIAIVDHLDRIYARRENATDNSFEIFSFQVFVNEYVYAIEPTPLVIDGVVGDTFDLGTKNDEIIGNQSNINLQVTYHLTNEDALNGVNNVNYTYVSVSETQVLYVRVQNMNSGCVAFTTLEISVNSFGCSRPNPLNASNITENSAELSWGNTNPLNDYIWEVEVVLDGQTPTGNGVLVNQGSYIVSGLDANTTYNFYVRHLCATDAFSAWTEPYSFTTLNFSATAFPYNVNPLPYQLYSQPLANTFNLDDAYSAYVNLGFTFNFFGHDYSQVIIGTNSVLSFDSEDENNFCPWSISGVLPNANDVDNAILGAYQDYYDTAGGSQVYGFIGAAPFRKFVLFFDDVALYNCTTTTSANQIIIYETYNFIDVQIKDRNVCNTWNSGNAVVGIQNIGGQEAYFPANRNTGDWEAHNEAWRFTPVQNHPDYQYIICDDDADGFATFDLNEVVAHFAPDTANGNVYSVYPTEDDAINNTNGIAIGNFVNTSNTQTIYFQEIDNTTGAVTLSSVLLAVIDCTADYDLDNIPSLNEDLNGNGNFGDDDTDGDNIPDFLDEDDDGDYVLTNVEAVDTGRANVNSYLDTDGDQIPNYLDNDDDGDGILSLNEDTNGNYNLLDDDTDGDNIPNYLDNEALSISENILHSFSIYPNPAKDILIFTIANLDDTVYYTIYNVQGTQVYNKQKVNALKTKTNISNLSVGVYFVKLESNNQTVIKKFVKK